MCQYIDVKAAAAALAKPGCEAAAQALLQGGAFTQVLQVGLYGYWSAKGLCLQRNKPAAACSHQAPLPAQLLPPAQPSPAAAHASLLQPWRLKLASRALPRPAALPADAAGAGCDRQAVFGHPGRSHAAADEVSAAASCRAGACVCMRLYRLEVKASLLPPSQCAVRTRMPRLGHQLSAWLPHIATTKPPLAGATRLAWTPAATCPAVPSMQLHIPRIC